jgi:hypothetical protein
MTIVVVVDVGVDVVVVGGGYSRSNCSSGYW